MSDDVEVSNNEKNLNWRLFGFGALGFGCLMLLGFVGWPVYQAHGDASEIIIYKKFVAMGILAIVTGINGIIFGEAAFSWFPSGDTNLSDIKLTTWIMLAVNGVIMVYGFSLFEGYLKGLGYDTSRL